MQRQLKALDDESINVFAHQDNTSPDPSKKTKIREENTEILLKINTQEELISAQQAKIDSLRISKDRAFDNIRDLKKDLRDIRKDIETHDTHILQNRSNMALLRSHVDEIRKDHRHILNKLETHDIKLNASGSLH